MSKAVLKADHLGITFGGLKAVTDFNAEIGEHELVGLIGPNGAGKTTIFNLLTGVYQPTEGSVYLDGKSMAGKKPHQMVKAGIARTFQNIRLFKDMTVIENVKVAFNQHMKYSVFGGMLRLPSFWKEEDGIDGKARELLRVFNMEDLAQNTAKNLPYGQQRKLEIARALATGAKVLLLDEPAAGMNPTETMELMNAIATIRERFGISIILIEHDMSLVMKICERIIVIDYGQIIATGTPAEVANNPKVIGAYLGE
ncbi:MAG: ABC transporter ATP-binding protein [Clostridiales bacterium]|uniref:Amino acid/amide ABC transporter ATP-binding protein 1 (HAAT family) n=1 Tax=Harryflintia acetispora TaxID=1849041 RepID=A0A9X8Y942_9FIRM|nr:MULTISPECIES: ABC transporter ATP-binding protein [Oscillospiraceae]PWM37280.1 MAG: ABC transporter ATP-binding protein [Clostridiales bacterium]RGB65436.1 ABC transporter ATP-binding protein [Harryflintia acetispora]TCL45113.1 amino acid/amide ABC transporter ATP-binding protein 1 (HAAT family) [Harryflintia acetispora]